VTQKPVQIVSDTRDSTPPNIAKDVLNLASGMGRAAIEIGRNARQAAR